MTTFEQLLLAEIGLTAPMWAQPFREVTAACKDYERLKARGILSNAIDNDLERSLRADIRNILVGYAMAQQQKVGAMKADAARRSHIRQTGIEPDGSSTTNPRRDAGHHPS